MQENIMKLLKRNFKVLGIYGSLLILYTFTFLYFRLYFHSHDQYSYIWISASIFTLAMFFTGLLFGKYCRIHEIGYYFGFFYHLMAFIIFNAMWLILIFAGLSLQHDLMNALIVIATWGIGLLFHFLFFFKSRKYIIKGMNKNEIFE